MSDDSLNQLNLPREQIELPKPLLDLPLPEKELPASFESYVSNSEPSQLPPQVPIAYRKETITTEAKPTMPQPSVLSNDVQNNTFADNYGRESVKTLISWHAPDRVYHKKGREYYINVILIILIIETLLFLFHQFTLMVLIVTLGFLVFALAVMPPNSIRYRISSEGIAVDENFLIWQELYDFYFTQREGEDVLHIRTVDYYPGEIVLHLGELHKNQLISILIPYLPYREVVQKTFMEKSGDWLSRTFPLDKLPQS